MILIGLRFQHLSQGVLWYPSFNKILLFKYNYRGIRFSSLGLSDLCDCSIQLTKSNAKRGTLLAFYWSRQFYLKIRRRKTIFPSNLYRYILYNLNSSKNGTGSRENVIYLFFYFMSGDWLAWLEGRTWLEDFQIQKPVIKKKKNPVWKISVNFYWMSYIYTLLYAGTQVSDCQEHRMGSCGYWLVYPSVQQSHYWCFYFCNGFVYPHQPTLVCVNGFVCTHATHKTADTAPPFLHCAWCYSGYCIFNSFLRNKILLCSVPLKYYICKEIWRFKTKVEIISKGA